MSELKYDLRPNSWTEIGEGVVTVSVVYDVNNGGYVPVFITTGTAAPEGTDVLAIQYPNGRNAASVFNVGVIGEKVYARAGFNRSASVIVSAPAPAIE